jgi:hypothetical protein
MNRQEFVQAFDFSTPEVSIRSSAALLAHLTDMFGQGAVSMSVDAHVQVNC